MAWGDYAPAVPDAAVGTPFNSAAQPFPDTPGRGLVSGQAIVRRLDLSGSASALDIGDDTNDSANDFVLGVPAPRNDAGQSGTVPASTCGNETIEGLETCEPPNVGSCGPTCITTAPEPASAAAAALAAIAALGMRTRRRRHESS